jgi:hypothetical protein
MKNPPKKSLKISKSDRLPPYWSSQRDQFNVLLMKLPEYNESIKKGLPFFTLDELEEIKKKYRRGITWKEIDEELSRKGMILNKNTFRKYIQDNLIPPSNSYLNTEKGREAKYPTDILYYINFIQYYYKIADNDLVDTLLELFSEVSINAKQAIEDNIVSNLMDAVYYNFARGLIGEGDDVLETINQVLQHDNEFMSEVISDLEKLGAEFSEKYEKTMKKLENYEIQMSQITPKGGQND